tara:strand:- start:516 stop:680 length:165 start_codon:yes stop_codon:yes gene_type:complete
MVVAILWAANLIAIVAIGLLAWIFKSAPIDFALGSIFATVIYNLSHRVIYRRWF